MVIFLVTSQSSFKKKGMKKTWFFSGWGSDPPRSLMRFVCVQDESRYKKPTAMTAPDYIITLIGNMASFLVTSRYGTPSFRNKVYRITVCTVYRNYGTTALHNIVGTVHRHSETKLLHYSEIPVYFYTVRTVYRNSGSTVYCAWLWFPLEYILTDRS